MKYIICLPLEILATIVAYITNPIVCLFADEYGNLPRLLYWWQTYDNCLDIDWMVYEHNVPSWAEYDFNKHYQYHLEEKFDDGTIIAGYVDILDGKFTLKEKLQRYVCRLCWMYRNCNYGFSYYVNGIDVDKDKLVVIKKQKTPYELCICYESGHNFWNTPWCIFIDKPYFGRLRLRAYLGWKLKSLHSGRHMLALFISPFRLVK